MPTADRNFQDWLDDDLWDEVVRDSEARLAAPAEFAAEALERLFLHESDKERGFARWDEVMAEGLWWADDALACLRLVMAGAPLPEGATLGRWTRVHAGTVWADTAEGPRPADDDAHAAWLRATVVRLESAFAAGLARLRDALAAEA